MSTLGDTCRLQQIKGMHTSAAYTAYWHPDLAEYDRIRKYQALSSSKGLEEHQCKH